METIQVVAGIIFRRDGRFLIARKSQTSTNPGLWEFPGGKIESEEQAEAALVREIREELRLPITNLQHFCTTEFHEVVSRRDIALQVYTCETLNEPVELTDHDMTRWVYREEIPNDATFVKADLEVIKKIKTDSGLLFTARSTK
jgi:8-oxo-dGTP diphosphatase